MFSAIRRLIFITLGVVFFVVFVVFVLRTIGQKMEYTNIDHPFLKWPFYLVANGGGNEVAPANTLKSFKHARGLNENIILSADLKMTADKVWMIYSDRYLDSLTTGHGLIERTAFQNIKDLKYKDTQEPLLTLKEFLDEFSEAHIILNILTTRGYDFNGLTELLGRYHLENNIIIRSPSSAVLRELRKVKPLWLYGADLSTLSKLSFFSSLGLESLAQIEADILVASSNNPNEASFSSSVSSELKRRKRKMIVLEDKYFRLEELNLYDGIMTNRPSQYLDRFK